MDKVVVFQKDLGELRRKRRIQILMTQEELAYQAVIDGKHLGRIGRGEYK